MEKGYSYSFVKALDSFDDMFSFLNRALETGLDDYSSNFPPTNISVDANESLIFEFAVAGYSPDDIEITFSGDSLRVESKTVGESDKKEDSKRKYFKKRIAKRHFNLKYTLAPGKFDTSKAEAIYENGILTISIPVNESSKPTVLKITSKK